MVNNARFQAIRDLKENFAKNTKSDKEILDEWLYTGDLSDSEAIAYKQRMSDYINTARKQIELETNSKPLSEFGTNYAEFYHDGANAVKKVMAERQGQVAGAFHRAELGDIDLVWGNAEFAKC